MDARSMREVLATSGSVGADLLAVDWSATSAGDPDDWSLSLRNAVRILLTSRFSMWLAWGPELTFFCNDAYRRDTLGAKYPWALGRPASEVWSEIWDDIAPRIDQVMTSGEATWDEALQLFLERSGYAEETYHTFSYSPLAGDSGAIEGMLCVVSEVTEQVVASRRMGTLQQLGIGVNAAQTEAGAMSAACELLALNPSSLPFAAVYLFEDDGATARRAGLAGIDPDLPATPELLEVGADPVWPVEAAWAGEATVVDDLTARFGPLPTGAWDESPRQVLVVPVPDPASSHPYGVLVVGLNPHRPLDASYRSFVELVAGHLSAALGDARAIALQTERAETLAALDAAKSDFFANVSHELRTPLTLLLGPAEDLLAEPEGSLQPEQRRRVELVVRNGRRMLQLVNTLLDFSRLDAGEEDARFVETDLGVLTRELVGMFESVADGAGLSLTLDCPAGIMVHVDRDHWSKIVLNLVSNALKFTFAGGVSVAVAPADGVARLTVSDTGTGIPAEDLPLLFDRFHRVAGARSRTQEGTGIGLALVAELVAVHGGRVDVASVPGEGTTFTVDLPLGTAHLPATQVVDRADTGTGTDDNTGTGGAEETVDDVLERHRARVVTDTVAGVRPEEPVATAAPGPDAARVLVCDDNADMRRYVVDLLVGDGYHVVTAVDGVDALEKMRSVVPDLVLTDVMMPRLDGFGLLRAMQADPELTAVPLVMLSARAGEEGTVEGLEAGADDYLVKPFSGRELLARVRVNLELDRSERVRRALERSQAMLDQAERLARIGSWEIDLDADTIVASDTFINLLELDRTDLAELGTAAVISRLVHPDDLDRVLGTIAGARAGELVDYETRVVLPSGPERLFAARAELLSDVPGSRVMRGSFQDITEQRATQQRLVQARADREAASRERAIADALQQSLLPPRFLDVHPLRVASFYRAGTEGTQVGGDWYDVIDLGERRVAVVIGDVMGHGITSAAVTGQLRAAVRALARLGLGPAEVLEQLDATVEELGDDQIVTCAYALLDAEHQTLTLASAGHPPVLLVSADDVRRLDATGPPLGAGFFATDTHTVDIEADDLLVLYTDGLVERRRSDLDGAIDRLVDTAAAGRELPVDELLDQILTTLVTQEVEDDVALLVARVVGSEDERVFERRLENSEAAPRSARQVAAARLADWQLPDHVRDDVVLAISELVTNALLHARPPIHLRMRDRDGELRVEIEDRTRLAPHRRTPDSDDEHGRGLLIVESVATAWGTRTTPVGKTVWCTFAHDG